MRDFCDCTCREGVDCISVLLSRLTILRPFDKSSPFSLLGDMLEALKDGDILSCIRSYHALTSALLNCSTRRVSGDIWRDYLLYLLMETPHPFAIMAASGAMDEPLYSAMRSELAVLGVLSSLKDEDIRRFALERQHDVKSTPHQKDRIELMSGAVWSGSAVRPMPQTSSVQASAMAPLISESDWLSWKYSNAGTDGDYVSDEALEEVYARLLDSSDWRPLVDDIWNFFASYGCGDFIKGRTFTYDPVNSLVLAPSIAGNDTLIPVSFYDMQHSRVMDHAIRFMQGKHVPNMLVCGGAGTGKTELLLSLLNELPELRLIVCNAAECDSLSGLLRLLSAQPLKFIILLEDVRFDSPTSMLLFSRPDVKNMLPDNVMLCATSRTKGEESVFPLCITLPYPSLNEFTEMVLEILTQYDMSVSKDTIRSQCLDHQVDAHDKLSLAAAKRIADNYISQY